MVMVMIGDVVRGALHNRGPSWCSVFDGGVEACHLFTCTLNINSVPTSKYAHAPFVKSAWRRSFYDISPSGQFQTTKKLRRDRHVVSSRRTPGADCPLLPGHRLPAVRPDYSQSSAPR